jgi:hypothetical protein
LGLFPNAGEDFAEKRETIFHINKYPKNHTYQMSLQANEPRYFAQQSPLSIPMHEFIGNLAIDAVRAYS